MGKPTEQGASSTEFILIALPMLFLALLCMESFHWWQTKNQLHYGLMYAGRQASMDYANPETLQKTFFETTKNWLRLSEHSNQNHDSLSTQDIAAVNIEITHPDEASFEDFGQALLYPKQARLYLGIDNHYQAERHLTDQKKWPEGLGAQSKRNRFQANILELKVSYLHRPLIPGLSFLLKQFSIGYPEKYRHIVEALGVFVLEEHVSIPMQTHALKFTEPITQHGIHISYGAPPTLPAQLESNRLAHCQAWWCQSNQTTQIQAPKLPTPSPITPEPPELNPPPELCGISLCCS